MHTGQWRLISAAVLTAGTLAAAGGAAYVLLGGHLSSGLRHTIGSPAAALLLVVGISATAMTLVLDEGLVGLLAGTVQLRRNAVFALGKLLLLGLLAALPIALTGTELLAVWVVSIFGSVGLLALTRAGRVGTLRPHLAALRALRGQALDHYLLNMALFLPRAALPLVVTVVLSTSATAGFYTAWMVVTVLAMIPGHLATTLFAVGAGDLRTLRGKVRVALAVALAMGVPLSLLTAAFAHSVMGVFGGGYAASAGGALSVLALTYIPTVVRQLFVAVSRVLGRVRRASVFALGAGLVELAAATYGGSHGGLTALARWLALVFVAEAVLMAPTVLRVIRPVSR
jgi:O-antigen/teichoic acid export membrane protein